MALIVEYHVVADMYPVGDQAISAGMLVDINAAGNIVPSPVNTANAVGIAGDSALAGQGQTTAYSDQLLIGAGGGWQGGAGGTQRWTSNRVSDFYDETAASDKITVYNGGGKFWVSNDLFDNAGAIVIANDLQVGALAAGEWNNGGTNALGDTVARAVGASQAYPSGVPGTDVQGSITLGDYVPLVLLI